MVQKQDKVTGVKLKACPSNCLRAFMHIKTTSIAVKQDSMTFATKFSVKTDETIVAWGNHCFKVITCKDPTIKIQRLKTKALSSCHGLRLVWKKSRTELADFTMIVEKNNIESKAVVCGNIISRMYPQRIVTWTAIAMALGNHYMYDRFF